MSVNSSLFIINKDTGELEVNKLEATKIPEFNVLFKRDKFSQGDIHGRKKLIACAEIYYIYLIYDVRSIYYKLPLEEKKLNARKDAKLPEKWKEDADLNKAIDKYKELFKLSSAGLAYSTAEKAYYNIAKDTDMLQDEIIEYKVLLKNRLDKLNKKNLDKLGDLELTTIINECNALIDKLLSLQKTVMNNIKLFKGLAADVKELEYAFIEEGGNLKIKVGGEEVGNRED